MHDYLCFVNKLVSRIKTENCNVTKVALVKKGPSKNQPLADLIQNLN